MSRAPEISIVVPTRNRPASLTRAVRSLFGLTGIDPRRIELVVVDNDAARSAEPACAELAAEAAFAVRYIGEPTPGVATARNAGVAAARAPLIAFLDDDEEASSGWLSALAQVQARFDADVVFGPVRGCAPPAVRAHRAYLEQFFSRDGPAEAQLLDRHFGCGCSLVRKAALPDRDAPFSIRQNQIGGEDDVLFLEMRGRGARFAWSPEAWVLEHPDPSRLSLAYTLRRAFAYGQGPSYACMVRRPPDRLGAAYWMSVGLGQATVFGALAALKWLARAPDRAKALDRAARGLGKVLWFSPFKPRFYGLP
jgi:glycosyltransferase involved in cell wall biosynthesis